MIDLAALTFQWPSLLWLLAALPLVALLYVRVVSRKTRTALRYPRLGLAERESRAVKAHAPAVLLLLGLAALIAAIARPQSVLTLPARVDTVMLAIDISGSMRAADIQPSRLAAAQDAVKRFLADKPPEVRVGVVAIAGSAAVVQSPTTNIEDVEQAIDRVQLQRGTALGSGLVIALAALLPEAGIDVDKIIGGGSRPGESEKRNVDAPKPAVPGANDSVAIVLLSDGESNVGPDPLKVAEIAADQGVRVYTVGIGTQEGATLTANGWSMRVHLDEQKLTKIASMTGAEYFRASSASELKKIYQSLGARLVLKKRQSSEITALFVALGAALAMTGVLLSLFWFNRIV